MLAPQQLQARDQHMQNFISSFPDEEASWKDKKEQASRVVVALLEHISENISRSQNLPSCVAARALPPRRTAHRMATAADAWRK